MPKKRKWILVAAAVVALVVGAFYTGYYFGERYAGEIITGDVYVEDNLVADATLCKTKYGDYVVILKESQYWVRREGENWNVGVIGGPLNFCGDSLYSRSVPLSGVFPPQAKTDPWDPKPKVNLNYSTWNGTIEFALIRGENNKVQFKMQ